MYKMQAVTMLSGGREKTHNNFVFTGVLPVENRTNQLQSRTSQPATANFGDGGYISRKFGDYSMSWY
jgi:hypothetical protein